MPIKSTETALSVIVRAFVSVQLRGNGAKFKPIKGYTNKLIQNYKKSS